MLIYNSVRGMDSTGAASVKRHEVSGKAKMIVAKELGHPFELLSITRKNPAVDFPKIIEGVQRALLGHCRSATRGSTERRNAHPFVKENIVGTHNGTLDWKTEKDLEGGLSGERFETDSEKFFSHLDVHGIAETAKLLKKEDQYAFVWYDTRDNTINFLRNSTRPFYFAMDKAQEQLFWSSEFYHLAAGIQDIPHEDKCIYELPEDHHYSWEIPPLNKKFGKAHVVKREGKKSIPLVTTHHRHSFQGSGTNIGNGSNFTPGMSNHGVSDKGFGGNNYSDWDQDYGEDYSPGSNDRGSMDAIESSTFYDSKNHLWTRYSTVTYKHKWAKASTGPWYESQQEFWDTLPFIEQVERAFNNQVPMATVVKGQCMDAVAARRRSTTKPIEEAFKVGEPEKVVPFDKAALIEKHKNNKLNNVLGTSERGTEVFKDKDRRVYWDNKDKIYTVCEYLGQAQNPPWVVTYSKICPIFVPFTQLDIAARHQFKHKGKKKKKVTYFRGFGSDMLVRQSFEKLMDAGCINCQRKPQWGNDVKFVNHSDYFCEFCAKDEDMVNSFRALAK